MEANIILWDGLVRGDLLPFTFTRTAAHIRTGILTIAEKYEKYFNTTPSFLTEDYLQKKYPSVFSDENILINAGVLPDEDFVLACSKLKLGESLFQDNIFLAGKFTETEAQIIASRSDFTRTNKKAYEGKLICIDQVWKIFQYNDTEIRRDFKLLTHGRVSAIASETNTLINKEDIFIEEGAVVECSVLNASSGPIYIGKDAEVMEGSLIRGPFALCEHGILKLGTKIYGATTIGPYCKVGGEVNNSVFFGYSNKGHDGFIGNAVIGEWCNFGADSNNSNLKNNYDEIKLWNYRKAGFVKTGLQYCGLFMGDHSKCGINTMFNTGTVVGVSANIFGAGFPRNFIPSFSWGGASGFSVYQLNKAYETAERVMERRNLILTKEDKDILDHIFQQTQQYRNF